LPLVVILSTIPVCSANEYGCFFLWNGMSKEYIFDPKVYFTRVVLTGIFCIFIFGFSLYMIANDNYTLLFILIAVVSAYTSWNALVSGANPNKIILEEDGISFVSPGRRIKYLFSEITVFLAKDFRGSGKIFLRINKAGFFKGRYWIHTREFNDSYELYLFIMKLEHQTHPNSITSKAWNSTRPEVDKTPVLPWNLSEEEKERLKTTTTI
jgi:hypothetical protein